MKILHLNTFDIRGGAARAANRIHRALIGKSIESEMLVSRRESNNSQIKEYPIPFFDKKLWFVQRLLALQNSKNKTHHSCNIFPSGISSTINKSDADIVHFHWISNELISIKEVGKINKPLVWTLHDMWAFCGAEHYDDNNYPGRYRERYGGKNRLNRHKGKLDVDAWTWRRKKKYWQNLDMNFVTPSRWLSSCLGESALFGDRDTSVIPNCLDTNIFEPKNREEARNHFNLPQDKRLILFCADGAKRNPLKGYAFFQDFLKQLAQLGLKEEIECIFFGRKAVRQRMIGTIPVREIGRFSDEESLAMVYSAADVFVSTSTMDNLPNTIMESMACGTPCLAFALGGIPDMVESGKNGYLAKPFDIAEMVKGLSWIMGDSGRYEMICRSARKKVEDCYSPAVVATQYRSLYQKILTPLDGGLVDSN